MSNKTEEIRELLKSKIKALVKQRAEVIKLCDRMVTSLEEDGIDPTAVVVAKDRKLSVIHSKKKELEDLYREIYHEDYYSG